MPRVRLKVKPAEEVATLSERRPDDELQVISSHQSDGRLLALLEAKTDDPGAFLDCFEDVFSEVLAEYTVVGEYDEAVLVQYELPTPELYRVGRELGSLVTYPIPITEGWMVFEQILPEAALSHVEAAFDESGYPYRIVSVTTAHEPMEMLTPRQQELVHAALERGYYDTPRRCSLTDLAAEFDVSKSVVSGVLHRAEERMIKEFVRSSPSTHPFEES